MGTKNIAFVIPAYNEEKMISSVVKDLRKSLLKQAYTFEIVVVDDGSKDRTAVRATKSGATVINHILNSGAGGATATGLSYADQNDFDYAITLDADGQHSTQDVLKGVKEIQIRKCDLLIGSRLINNDGMSKVKVLGNRGLSIITYILFGINTTDSQSGLRVFSKKALEQLRWKTNGYEFCSEMLWRAKQQGLRIEEYPIQAIYSDYSTSKGQNNWNGFNIVASLVKRRVAELMHE